MTFMHLSALTLAEEVNFSFNVRIFLYSISRTVVHTVIVNHPANGEGDAPANLQVYTATNRVLVVWEENLAEIR